MQEIEGRPPSTRRSKSAASCPARRAAAICALALAVSCSGPTRVEREWAAMGAPARAVIVTTTEKDANLALDDVQAAFERVESTMSYRLAESELSALNRQAGDEFYGVQDHDLYRMVLLALEYARVSRGAYDPTVAPLIRLFERDRAPRPAEITTRLSSVGWDKVVVAEEARAVRFRAPGMELDLSAVMRGFALDAAARSFSRPGTRAGLLGLGGSFYAWSHPPGAESWTVEIPDPRDPSRMFLEIDVSNRGLSVSGAPDPSVASRVDAATLVIDPRSGRPAAGDVRAAVAIADSAADATALAQALFVSGYLAATDLLGRMQRVEAILLVEGDGSPYLLASQSLQGRIRIGPELEAETGGRIRYLLGPSSL